MLTNLWLFLVKVEGQGQNNVTQCQSTVTHHWSLLIINIDQHLLRSAVGMAHVLQSGLVMGYTTSYYTQKSTISTLALKPSVSPPFYPWVTATTLLCWLGESIKIFKLAKLFLYFYDVKTQRKYTFCLIKSLMFYFTVSVEPPIFESSGARFPTVEDWGFRQERAGIYQPSLLRKIQWYGVFSRFFGFEVWYRQ